ncbi:MAG: hypothetical protein WC966_04330 [Bradymonadales bacterium]|jgi:Cys-rich repeat protein
MGKRVFLAVFASVLMAFMASSCCTFDDFCYDDWHDNDCTYCGDWDSNECNWNSDCGDGYSCISNRCILDWVCKYDAECGGRLCRDGACVDCTDTLQCGSGKVCNDNGICVIDIDVERPECLFDLDCADGQRCEAEKCVDKPRPDCRIDADCADGFECSAGVCVERSPECVSNSDCKEDEICTKGECIPCQTEVCEPGEDLECVFGADCDSGLCVDGKCQPMGACVTDANCDEGLVCLNGSCQVKPECLQDADCGEGKICNAENKCEDDVECRADKDCSNGLFCAANICVECRLNCECSNEGDLCVNGFCVAP